MLSMTKLVASKGSQQMALWSKRVCSSPNSLNSQKISHGAKQSEFMLKKQTQYRQYSQGTQEDKPPHPNFFQKFFVPSANNTSLFPTIVLTAMVGAAIYITSDQDLGTSTPSTKAKRYPKEDPKVTSQLLGQNSMALLSFSPTRVMSSLAGVLATVTIPEFLRSSLFGWYIRAYNVIESEIPRPITEYESFNQFFTRRIDIEKCRPIAKSELVSPVDGFVLSFGKCDSEWSQQVKGVWYSLEDFMGKDYKKFIRSLSKDKNLPEDALPELHYCVIYLAPGDYHGVHSPVEWVISKARHFTGHLFSVSPATSRAMRGLLAINERVVLAGTYPHGFFSLTPVGATNVGSITLEFKPGFDTNEVDFFHPTPLRALRDLPMTDSVKVEKGKAVSFFNLGSTVVLIFEAPESFQWKIELDQQIKLGAPLFGSM